MAPVPVRFALRVGSALGLLFLAGCASMSEKECLAVDWRTVGYEDGVRGYSGDRIANYRKACAKYGVRADLDRYQEGRADGLKEYCRPANGYRVGRAGGSYGGVCPAPLEAGFERAWQSGHRLYVLEARVSGVESALEARNRELAQVQRDIAAASVYAIAGDGTAQQKADAVVDTAQLAERAGRLKEEIRQLEVHRVEYIRDLDDYRASVDPEE